MSFKSSTSVRRIDPNIIQYLNIPMYLLNIYVYCQYTSTINIPFIENLLITFVKRGYQISHLLSSVFLPFLLSFDVLKEISPRPCVNPLGFRMWPYCLSNCRTASSSTCTYPRTLNGSSTSSARRRDSSAANCDMAR